MRKQSLYLSVIGSLLILTHLTSCTQKNYKIALSTADQGLEFKLNNGEPFTPSPMVISLSRFWGISNDAVYQIREADLVTRNCPDPAEGEWIPYPVNASAIKEGINNNHILSYSDGPKKLCLYGRTGGKLFRAGADIHLNLSHPPVITSFSVDKTGTGSRMHAKDAPLVIHYSIMGYPNIGLGWKDGVVADFFYTTDNQVWTHFYSHFDGSSPVIVPATSYTGFKSPSSSYFRIKMIAYDRAGNTSVPVISDAQNQTQWGFVFGNNDSGIGGSAKSASISHTGNANNGLAIHSKTNEAFLLSSRLLRLSPRTGRLEVFIESGEDNLGATDPAVPVSFPPRDANGHAIQPTLPFVRSAIQMDAQNRLYVRSSAGGVHSAKIYQIDLAQGTVRLYAGGYDNSITIQDSVSLTASNILSTSAFAIDLQDHNSLYFFSPCTDDRTYSTMMIWKIAQNNDGSPGAVTRIAGNCSTGVITNGDDAKASPLHRGTVITYANSLAAAQGILYYDAADITLRKLIRSGSSYKIFNTQVPNHQNFQSLYFNRAGTKLYQLVGSRIDIFDPTPGGVDEGSAQVFAELGAATSTEDCPKDGIEASHACTVAVSSAAFGPNDTLFFADGSNTNNYRPERIRYVQRDGGDGKLKVQTLAGSLPFLGESPDGTPLEPSAIRGTIGGIDYKTAADPNQGAFPEGLYFMDYKGGIFGRIAPDNKLSVIWGNQNPSASAYAIGDGVSASKSMGQPYGYSLLQSMIFDTAGLPWLRQGGYSVSLNNALKIQNKMIGWCSPSGAFTGGHTNYALNGTEGTFNLAIWRSMSHGPTNMPDYNPVILSYQATATGMETRIMGEISGVTNSANPGVTHEHRENDMDNFNRNDFSFDPSMIDSGSGFLVYRQDQGRLYFSEVNSIRYIEFSNKNDIPNSAVSLKTFINNIAGVRNFIFSKDNLFIYYIRTIGSSTKLYRCEVADIFATTKNCSSEEGLGPNDLIAKSLGVGANQLTWKPDGSSQTLLISDYGGRVLYYDLTSK